MAPAILIYLALSFRQGAKKIADKMDHDEEKFEQDLLAIYAPMEYGKEDDNE